MLKRAFVAINPIAGGSKPKRAAARISKTLGDHGWDAELYHTDGSERERRTFHAAISAEFDLAIAVGGDGTVGAVADSLIGSEIPLGIIPAGTGNGIAKELGIPLGEKSALETIRRSCDRRAIDAMRVGDQHYFLAIGIGFTARAVRDTDAVDKRRFGMLAYFGRGVQQLLGIQPYEFEIRIDGLQRNFGGIEALLVNAASFGEPYLRWATEVSIDDGALEAMVFRTRNLNDIIAMSLSTLLSRKLLDPRVSYMRAYEQVCVHTTQPLPVQADGDLIGTTPLEVRLVPSAVDIIVPSGRG
jgi:YegS/Rv2252/BmrU family lipid kinase